MTLLYSVLSAVPGKLLCNRRERKREEDEILFLEDYFVIGERERERERGRERVICAVTVVVP